MTVHKPPCWTGRDRDLTWFDGASSSYRIQRSTGRLMTIEFEYDTGEGQVETGLHNGLYEVPLFCLPVTGQLMGTWIEVLTAGAGIFVGSSGTVDPATGLSSWIHSGGCYWESTSLATAVDHGFIPGCRFYSQQQNRRGEWLIVQLSNSCRLHFAGRIELLVGDGANENGLTA